MQNSPNFEGERSYEKRILNAWDAGPIAVSIPGGMRSIAANVSRDYALATTGENHPLESVLAYLLYELCIVNTSALLCLSSGMYR